MLDRRPAAIISVHACPYSEIGGAENGGMSVYIREVTGALAERGLPSVIFTRRDDPAAPRQLELPGGCRLVHVDAGPAVPLDKNSAFYHLPDFFRGVVRYAREQKVDFRLIHSHYWLSGWVGERLGQLWGVPWLHTAHTLARVKHRDQPPGAAAEADQRIAVEAEIVRRCNRLLAPTAQEVEDLATLYDAGRDCVTVVPLGVDKQLFRPVPARALRSRLGLGSDDKVILFTGRLERLKGVDTLIRALALIRKRRAPARAVRLLVVGADSGNGKREAAEFGGERARLEALARELGLAGDVWFLGAVGHDQLPEYYSLADVCAIPSHSESFGLVALEAQACATPVVASRVGGLRQLVLDGITGYTVSRHQPELYAAALTKVLDDSKLAAGLGSAGRHLASTYSWRNTANGLLRVYEETEADYHRAAAALLG